MPVFRASSGKGVEVYPSWTDGTRSNLSDAELAQSLDLRSSLSTFYKHPLVDSWNEWIITKVSEELVYNQNSSCLNCTVSLLTEALAYTLISKCIVIRNLV